MSHSEILTIVYACIISEVINVFVNILPARRQTTAAAKRPYYIRMGVFNFIFVLGVIAYVILHK